jgi:hypothetical protein
MPFDARPARHQGCPPELAARTLRAMRALLDACEGLEEAMSSRDAEGALVVQVMPGCGVGLAIIHRKIVDLRPSLLRPGDGGGRAKEARRAALTMRDTWWTGGSLTGYAACRLA